MNREYSITKDINITHDLSRKVSHRKSDRLRNWDCELHITSIIEMRNNNIKEAH